MNAVIEKQSPVYHYDVLQGSEEWNDLRLGRMTGSGAGVFLTESKKAKFEAGVTSYIYQKAAEWITGEIESIKPNFSMERGTELEPFAIANYEEETYNQVNRVGFVSLNRFVGCSPDGLVGEDGIIEVKCPMHPEFIRYADTKVISKDYIAQIQFGLFVTGRKWCDFIVYHPQFKDGLLIDRIHRNEKMINRFEEAAEYFESEIKRLWDL